YPIDVSIVDETEATNQAVAHSHSDVLDAPVAASAAAPAVSSRVVSGVLATFTDANPFGTVADFSATIDWGDGVNSAGVVAIGSGGGFAVSGSHTYSGTGYRTISTTIADVGGSHAGASSQVLVYAFVDGGSFVVGDRTATGAVTFWGAQWSRLNTLSG